MMSLDNEQINKLEQTFLGVEECDGRGLTPWEQEFIANMQDRYNTYGEGTFVSPKQWAAIGRIWEKVGI